MKRILQSRWSKPVLFLLCLIPLFRLAWRAYAGTLGPNPIEFITHSTGDWTIRFLMITLSVTPLRLLLHQPVLLRFRRMLGLFAFFYVFLHFVITYLWFDKFFDFHEIMKDIVKRPFITVGFTAFVLLVPLAITSTDGWQRRIGKRWQTLHRAVYFAALAGVIHYYWLVKSDVRLPLLYGAIFAVLMLYRLWMWSQKPRAVRKPQPAPAARV